jgi:hypothetical protein
MLGHSCFALLALEASAFLRRHLRLATAA